MTLALLLLMSYQLVGEKAHEWIGQQSDLQIFIHFVIPSTVLTNFSTFSEGSFAYRSP